MDVAVFAAAAIFVAHPTERVMPDVAEPCRLQTPERVTLSLARNEKESVQIVVSATEALEQVRVEVAGLPLRVDCDTVAYTRTTNTIHYTSHSVGRPAWYPDTLMPTPAAGVRIRPNARQSFWLRVHARTDTAAGVYRGLIVVKSGAKRLGALPVEVRVRSFALPPATVLPLAVTFDPATSLPPGGAGRKQMEGSPDSPLALWRRHQSAWYALLADYGLAPDNLYWNNTPGDAALADEEERWRCLKTMRGQDRLGWFNLGYFAPLEDDREAEAVWRRRYLAPISRAYARAAAEGLLEHAYVYGCDETPTGQVAAVARAIAAVKRECPGVPVMTTAKDARRDGARAFGVDSPLAVADVVVPLTDKYDPVQAQLARAQGRQVWWYVCCWPHGREANLFLESLPIEARLLVGAMAVRMRVDGFLYYETAMWNSLRTVGSDPYTDWTAQSWEHYNGDGSLLRADREGRPLPTIRLENLRDGLEDYAYAWCYRRLYGSLPAVPAAVASSTAEYSCDGAALQAWRDALAEAIEAHSLRDGSETKRMVSNSSQVPW